MKEYHECVSIVNIIPTLFLKAVEVQEVQESQAHKALSTNQRISTRAPNKHNRKMSLLGSLHDHHVKHLNKSELMC